MPRCSPAPIRPRDIPLSRALMMLIEELNNKPANHKSLQLFARRFACQQSNWHATNLSLEKNTIEFIHQYIRYLPTAINDFDVYCRKLHWLEISSQVSHILGSYFDNADSEQLNVGILGILDKAYFSHRLIEELHDHMICVYGNPVLVWNMSSANLFVHQLLGDRYCSKLDSTIIELSEKLIQNLPSKTITANKSSNPHWPCFCNHFNVALEL